MTSIDDLRRGPATISVVEAGRVLGIGRDASYAAAERGEIPTIKIGHRLLRVPVPRLLELLGVPLDVELKQTNGEAATAPPLATIHALAKSTGGTQHAPHVR